MRLGPPSANPKPERVDKESEKEGDVEFYDLIWKTHLHICEETGERLHDYNPNDPEYTYKIRKHIAHVLRKSKYPQFRHNPNNVIILSFASHQRADNGDPRQWRKMKIWPKCERIMIELIGEVPNSHKSDSYRIAPALNNMELTPELTQTIIDDMVNGIRHNTYASFEKQCNRLKVMLAMDAEATQEGTRDAIRIMHDRYGLNFQQWAKDIPEIVEYNNKQKSGQ